jgi:beta-lactamase class A
MLTRRSLLAGGSALLCSCALPFCQSSGIAARLEAIRARIGGRLGVHALDTGSGERIGLDDGARYALASTFKLLLAACVLQRCDRGLLAPDQRVTFGRADLLAHAPATGKYVARGWMTVEELWTAIVTVSDNPAANLLLRTWPATRATPAARARWWTRCARCYSARCCRARRGSSWRLR